MQEGDRVAICTQVIKLSASVIWKYVPLLAIALSSGAGSPKYIKSDFNADQVMPPTLAHHGPYLGSYCEYGNETGTNVFGLIFCFQIMCT
jgi:hypothetical protein